MKCSYCDNEPLFKCACKDTYMCQTHLGQHLQLKFECARSLVPLEKPLEYPSLRDLHSKIKNILSTLNQAELHLIQQAKSLIALVETLTKASIQKIELIRKDYQHYLNKSKFFRSEMPKLKEIESTRVNFKQLDLNDIVSRLNQVYNQEILNIRVDQNLSFFNYRTGEFRCGAVTKDGSTLVAGGLDSKIRVWDLIEKKQSFVLHGHNS